MAILGFFLCVERDRECNQAIALNWHEYECSLSLDRRIIVFLWRWKRRPSHFFTRFLKTPIKTDFEQGLVSAITTL